MSDKRRVPSGFLTAAVLVAGLGHHGGTSAELNDTGVVTYQDKKGHSARSEPSAYPGQDARFGRDMAAAAGKLKKIGAGSKGFDFSKLDAEGKDLPANAKKWSCVRDNVTGLIWEVKTADGGLRDREHKYSWYNPNSTTNGGAAGVQNGGQCGGGIACDTHSYVQAVNATRLCGYSDWRMPWRWELRSIVDYSKAAPDGPPAVDEAYFANMPINPPWVGPITYGYMRLPDNKWFWTGSPEATGDDQMFAWRLTFRDGNDGFAHKQKLNHVILVRGGR